MLQSPAEEVIIECEFMLKFSGTPVFSDTTFLLAAASSPQSVLPPAVFANVFGDVRGTHTHTRCPATRTVSSSTAANNVSGRGRVVVVERWPEATLNSHRRD